MKRPWSGQLEKSSEEERPDFDPTNPLCPGININIFLRREKYFFEWGKIGAGESVVMQAGACCVF